MRHYQMADLIFDDLFVARSACSTLLVKPFAVWISHLEKVEFNNKKNFLDKL
jgi:hypothetical protein